MSKFGTQYPVWKDKPRYKQGIREEEINFSQMYIVYKNTIKLKRFLHRKKYNQVIKPQTKILTQCLQILDSGTNYETVTLFSYISNY